MSELLWVIVLVLTAPCASEQLFSFSRSQHFPHLLTFTCEDINGPVSNPWFFRNGLPVNVTSSTNNQYLFSINRMLEGNFSCGSTNRSSSNDHKIVAFPDDGIEPINRGPFSGEVGSIIRLNCSITPGVVVEQYYVTWRSASDPSIVFYQSFSPHLNFPVINRDSQRYFVDPSDFSLSIHNITPADGAQDYVCVLAVEDTVSVSRSLIYFRTENVNLSVSVSMAPVIMEHPKDEVVISNNTVNFTCSVLSSPDPVLIDWLVNQTLLSNNQPRVHIIHRSQPSRTGGVISWSTVVISDVTGLDSSFVRCRIGDISSTEAKLDVLDVVVNLNPIALETGGFLFDIDLKAQLQIPVRLMFLYFEVGSDNSRSFMSREQYINTVLIRHVESEDRVPFDKFQVEVALVYQKGLQEPLVGPSFGPNIEYSRAGLTDLNIWLITIVVVVGVILALLIVALCTIACTLPHLWTLAKGEIRAGFASISAGSTQGKKEEAKPDPAEQGNKQPDSASVLKPKSRSFDEKSGKRYMKALAKTIEFAKSDPLLSDLLKKELSDLLKKELRSESGEDVGASRSQNDQMKSPPGVQLKAAIPIEKTPSSPTKNSTV